MSDTTILIVGMFVFGISILSTMIAVIPPNSSEDIARRKALEHPKDKTS
jgi:hypothetical protein